jgi:hypothetical protein
VLARPVERRHALLGLGIIALNLVDAFGTLGNINHGAQELNPLMALLLGAGDGRFLVIKHLLASLGVTGILLHPEVRAARAALWVLFPLYVCIATYQITLLLLIG